MLKNVVVHHAWRHVCCSTHIESSGLCNATFRWPAEGLLQRALACRRLLQQVRARLCVDFEKTFAHLQTIGSGWHCLSRVVQLHAMDERPSKLARVQSLRSRLPFISQSALSTLLKIAKDTPLPDASISRQSIGRARDSGVLHRTPYGTLHRQVSVSMSEGADETLEVQSPPAMLYHVCNTSIAFSELIESAAATRPPSVVSPWTLVLYTDEILPGNQLSYKGARKMWGFYWTILELGTAALSNEERATVWSSTYPRQLLKHLSQ